MTMSEKIDQAFSPIAQAVERFASERSFCLAKCPRGNAGWELTKPHDSCGDVTLLLLFDESQGLGVGSVWQFPCPEMSTLYSHFRPIHACALDPDAVTAELESELTSLSQVPFGYWTHLQPLVPSS